MSIACPIIRDWISIVKNYIDHVLVSVMGVVVILVIVFHVSIVDIEHIQGWPSYKKILCARNVFCV